MNIQMTFEEFQQSAKRVDDLRDALEFGRDLFEQATPGIAYAGGLYVETNADGSYCLTIANDSKSSSNLAELEADLFDYGQREMLLTNETVK